MIGIARITGGRSIGRGLILGTILLALIGLSLTSVTGADAATKTYSLFSHTNNQTFRAYVDRNSVELGVRFTSSQSGILTKVSFIKTLGDVNSHAVSVWSANGTLLAQKRSSNETKSGWQSVTLDSPIAIQAGQTYIVSYHTSRYAATNNFFKKTVTAGALKAVAGSNGVFAYNANPKFPTQSYKSTNYWVDPTFTPTVSAHTLASVVVTHMPPTTTVTAPTTTTTPTVTSTTVAPTTSTTVAPTTTSTTIAPPPSSGFPDVTNTGYQHAPGYPGSLTNCDGLTIQDNTTYSFCYFPHGLEIGTSGAAGPQNVSFIGCLFESDFNGVGGGAETIVKYSNGNNITFDYDTFKPTGISSPPVSYAQGVQYAINQVENAPNYAAGSFSVNHSNMWGLAEALQLGSSDQTHPITISNTWIHDARADGGIDHTDGILVNGGGGMSYLTIDHNTIVSAGNTNGIGLQGTGYHHDTVTNNYVSGWGYTVAFANDTSSNTYDTFTGNVFGTDIQPVYGPIYIQYGGDDDWHTGLNNLWRNNTIHVAPGGFVSDATADGKYWQPQWSNTGYPDPATTDWAL